MYIPVWLHPSRPPTVKWVGVHRVEEEFPYESPESFHAVRARAQNRAKLAEVQRRAEKKLDRRRRQLSLWRRIRDGPPPGSCVRPEWDWCRTAWTPERRAWWLASFPVRKIQESLDQALRDVATGDDERRPS